MFTIDSFLAAYMKEQGIKHGELAKRLGVHVNTLRNWLNADCYPSMAIAQDVLRKLGYDLVVIDKEPNAGSSVAQKKPVCCFDSYERTIYDRGRMSAFGEVAGKVVPTLEDVKKICNTKQ